MVRQREEFSEQIRAFDKMKSMAAKYGFDIGRPAETAQEAVQWLYFGYLAAVKEKTMVRQCQLVEILHLLIAISKEIWKEV